ncbi:MAG: response regulator transcription factor [Ruminococcaceae bacterium]|nr:response regulator transcription factor [Oscillospiraceae bacterium]
MNDSKKKILIVEDEKNIAQVLAFNLMQAGYDYEIASDGEEGLKKALRGNFDLILLDIMLPKMDGFTVCRGIRMRLDTPIIMVTAKEEDVDKILGLDLGADDYVTKPFSVNVLLARIKANLRRSANEVVTEAKASTVLEVRELVIDNEKYSVTKAGEPIALSKIEYDLLAFLAANQGKPFKREELLESVWGYKEFFGDRRTVDVTVSRLRNKIETDPTHPEYIFSKHGYGYYLA